MTDHLCVLYREWVDGTKEPLLILESKQEAEEECLIWNNTRLPRSHREYKYMYEELEPIVIKGRWF